MFVKGFIKKAGITGDWKLSQKATDEFSRGARQGSYSLSQMWANAKDAFRPINPPTPPNGAPKNVGLMSN